MQRTFQPLSTVDTFINVNFTLKLLNLHHLINMKMERSIKEPYLKKTL